MPQPQLAADSLPMRVKAFYQRVSDQRDAALEDLPKLYTADVHFINPVVDERGLPAFTANWQRAFKQYKVFLFDQLEVSGTEQRFTLTYSMRVKFSFGPVFVTEMATECDASGGKVSFCRDYFDPLGTLVGPFAPLKWVYRKVFGLLVA